ncbi:4-(cytidine 5'-diphospho)-2-C-methyl-D-erythritol kinase [Falsirhodobacter algicola]|uniref:4-diphosphocytidyl-2-C-methyl-D-erythritol kinase n=1 Tax=Falsirhodobacter algicola TaxID=2692330 RepID=A0A8J8SKG9_9RHOB|nr:4-(cytidine 5'-diphospho)-2-C-methyl-D-erythritol kinase [Falsirhodobacter algicola]QUS35890.1 4-(cytidine 5'-diphospho)-2-C-methyl-D-erythritol kinase [Falsirhodobacter algicola]
MTRIEALARAKINLTLHVTGRREDGYHLLDSLVVFAGIGDTLSGTEAEDLTLSVSGPEAEALRDEPDNLVLRAARLMGGRASLRLEKVLPVASGIGGGSADAAAALKVMAGLTGRSLPRPEDVVALGADVPVCLNAQAVRMSGIGERLYPVLMPKAWLVLANPRVPVPTGQVFARLGGFGAPMPDIPVFPTVIELARWLRGMRNDLEEPARQVAPIIGTVRDALDALPGCLMARMSGSGATCFGLFSTEAEARAGAARLPAAWWTAAAPLEA